MMSPYEIKKEICEIGRRIYMNGFVAANDGNISVKVSENEYYCTPTGVSKGFMTPDMIIKIDADGNKLEGKLNPSSEIKMHMRVYRERPDVNAVVHAHPPTATAYAVAGIPLDKYLLPEAILVLGDVPICKYGTPSTMEIPDSLEPYIQTHDAFLLQNHGALTVGCNLTKAFFVMEEVEFSAKIAFMAPAAGQPERADLRRAGQADGTAGEDADSRQAPGLQEVPQPGHRKLQVQAEPARRHFRLLLLRRRRPG